MGLTLRATGVMREKRGDIPDLVVDDNPTVAGGIMPGDLLRRD